MVVACRVAECGYNKSGVLCGKEFLVITNMGACDVCWNKNMQQKVLPTREQVAAKRAELERLAEELAKEGMTNPMPIEELETALENKNEPENPNLD